MYNPVNMHVEDEDRLKEKDLREKNKKRRYEVRYDFEQVTRKETLAEQDRLENMKLAKIKYERVQEEVERGFNIINNGDLPQELNKKNFKKFMKPQVGVWDRLSPKGEDAKANDFTTVQVQQAIQMNGCDFQTRSRRISHQPANHLKTHENIQKPPSHSSMKPHSHHSVHPSSQAKMSAQVGSEQGSRRAVRTGGFQRMGQEIVAN